MLKILEKCPFFRGDSVFSKWARRWDDAGNTTGFIPGSKESGAGPVSSAESKAKMRSSLRCVWGQRLKWKRLREKLFLSWVESIAEAAKKGGSGQQELCWDSYEKIKQKLHLQELQRAAEKKKEKAKERAKKRAMTAEQVKEKNLARITRERRKDGEVYEDTEELTVLQGRNCKQRLMKVIAQ
ncbi:unnamed protein product [Prunus armeniaca]|uniref:Uncharacterized protein n=1 Tax=Prunus armeniaca TaxID=36596 RepID=A0A6J5X4L0_PRUAR|nr:unnamed protein product [Prunus armeniaca]